MMMARSMHTNEPARCAMVLPLLARLSQPLALLTMESIDDLTLMIDKIRGCCLCLTRKAAQGKPARFDMMKNAAQLSPH
jgi:hypothetical protein